MDEHVHDLAGPCKLWASQQHRALKAEIAS